MIATLQRKIRCWLSWIKTTQREGQSVYVPVKSRVTRNPYKSRSCFSPDTTGIVLGPCHPSSLSEHTVTLQSFTEETEAGRTELTRLKSELVNRPSGFRAQTSPTPSWVLHSQTCCLTSGERGGDLLFKHRLICWKRVLGTYSLALFLGPSTGGRANSGLGGASWTHHSVHVLYLALLLFGILGLLIRWFF